MKARWLSIIAALALTAGGVSAQNPPPSFVPAAPAPPVNAGPGSPAMASPGSPALIMEPPVTPAVPGAACSGPGCATEQAAPFTPFMLGDFMGPVANLFTNFKIAEGESPRPTDRVFFKYNYYNNVNPTRWENPFEPIHHVDLDTYTFGMEKTLFDGLLSVGVRMPFYTMRAEAKDIHLGTDPLTGALAALPGGPGFTETEFSNLVGIVKAVLWEDRPSGDLLSAGMVVSFPTSNNAKLDPGLSLLTYVQPFSGFILNSGDWFLQGFSSMTLPIAHPESIVSFTDVGVGYWLLRDTGGSGFVSGLAPTFEIHYTAPIRQPDPTATIFGNFVDGQRVHNTVDLTAGATAMFSNRATLGVGLVVPVTGLRPFDVEGTVQLNFLF
jgi:hypothetical protein